MLAEDLSILRLAVMALVVLGALCAAFGLQRMYYCRKSAKCRTVERSRFRPGEALLFLVGLAVIVAAVTGSRTLHNLMSFEEENWSYFIASVPNERVKELDVAEVDASGATILLYPASDMGVRADVPEEAWLQTSGERLMIEVEVIRFHAPLAWLGQKPLVRVTEVRGFTPASSEQSEDETEPANALTEPKRSSRVILDLLFKASTQRYSLMTERAITPGDVYVIQMDAEHQPVLRTFRADELTQSSDYSFAR